MLPRSPFILSMAICGVTWLLPVPLLAQRDTSTTNTHDQSTLFISFLGNSGLYAVGYDHGFRTGRSGMSISLGGSYLPRSTFIDKPRNWHERFTVPVQWNWFHGRKGRMEHGLGATYSDGLDWAEKSYPYYQGVMVSRAIWLVVKPVAYRWQRRQGGFFFRAQVDMLIKWIEFDPEWIAYVKAHGELSPTIGPGIGVDIGYTFKRKQTILQ